MATPYTADDLLVKVRNGASASSVAATGQADADLLGYADDELRDTLIPLLLGVQEEFYERTFDTATVSGTAGYRLNKRVALSRINAVQLIQSGASPSGNLVRIEPKRALDLSPVPGMGQPWAYYLEGGRLILFPTPNAAATLRVRAMVRPSRLVLSTDSTNVKPITSVYSSDIDGTPVSSGPSALYWALGVTAHGISIGTAAARDVVAATPSFEHVWVDQQVGYMTANLCGVLKTAVDRLPEVGDYLCLSDTTPYVQLPVELQPSLVELVVAKLLRARGVGSEAKDHADEAERLVGLGIQALTPRVDTANRKLVGGPHFRRRGYGLLRGS